MRLSHAHYRMLSMTLRGFGRFPSDTGCGARLERFPSDMVSDDLNSGRIPMRNTAIAE